MSNMLFNNLLRDYKLTIKNMSLAVKVMDELKTAMRAKDTVGGFKSNQNGNPFSPNGIRFKRRNN